MAPVAEFEQVLHLLTDTLARSKGRQHRLEIVVVIAKLNQRLFSEIFQQALPQLRRVGCRLNDGGQEMLL